MSSLNGVLPLDKPVGPTSHDVVAIARRALGVRRIGHTGTLDPFASGLLLLCVGPSTRLAEYITGLPKSYSARLRLGMATDTDDLEGAVVRSSDDWTAITQAEVESALGRLEGDQLQVPPRYSAKKIGGERMYAIARAGREVDPEPVPVRISRIELTWFLPPDVDFEVDCSSGTYIRSIARDIGDDLGVGAHLTALRRTKIGNHTVDAAVSIGDLNERTTVATAMLTPAAAVAHLPRVAVTEGEIQKLAHGGAISAGGEYANDPLALLSDRGELVAIGRASGDLIQPTKVFL
jgi:tRNA pseudouridine55 synthase